MTDRIVYVYCCRDEPEPPRVNFDAVEVLDLIEQDRRDHGGTAAPT